MKGDAGRPLGWEMQRLTRRDVAEIFIAVALTVAALAIGVSYVVEATETVEDGGVRTTATSGAPHGKQR